MEWTPTAAADPVAEYPQKALSATRTTSAGRRVSTDGPKMRKYDVLYLTAGGQIAELSCQAPALSQFEDAFGALGHGAILQTRNGPMAVEDLLPGDVIRLADGSFDTLLWRGMMTIMPDDHPTRSSASTLTRITSDALGPQRPSPDLVLGPTARLYHRANGIKALTGKDAAYIPASDFIDGSQFIELRPAAPVNVYQLGFADHQRLSVNGIEVESLHPGTTYALGLRRDDLAQYLALFPHKRNLDDFGLLAVPRLRLRDLDLFLR